ncbi:MAG: TolC family protein [Acidobacteria bacterium]|nr:TolC family protein [Acidobacteriota bacterium]
MWRWLHGAARLIAVVVLGSVLAEAQEPAPPVLTLREAIQLAIANNRSLEIAKLEVDKSKWQIAEFKTKRLPAFSTSVLASQLLTEMTFTFKEGTFGDFPSTGPIPNKDTKITTPRRPTAYVVGQAMQPLSQLYKIHLGVRAQQLGSQVTSEKARAESQALVRDVKQAYYGVLQAESALQVSDANLKQYQELDRVVTQRLSQEAALKSDSMDVKVKLVHEQYSLVQLRNMLSTRKEYLNNLLGRDIRTAFSVEAVPEAAAEELELPAAQQRALTQRPEVRQAELEVKQAEYSRRMARADYIPDLGIAFNYLSPFNVEVLPKNVASIGLELKWEPWDWGRRKDVVQQKKIVETQAQAQMKEVRAKVLMDVNNRFRKLEESRALIGVTQAEKEAAQERLREVTHKYGQQAVLLSDVLRQQATAAGAGDDYQQALLGFWTAKSEFEKSLGEDQ